MKKETDTSWFLEEWSFGIDERDEYKAPEQLRPRLMGRVHNHPNHRSGGVIHTSPVVEYDEENDVVITQSGSCYKLGEPHPDYERQFPNAKERLIKALKEE